MKTQAFAEYTFVQASQTIIKKLMNKIGSSETIRKTTFDFYSYKQNLVSHKTRIDIQFLEWFIGFVEGDGSFIVSNTRLFFIINQKEEKILHYIRTNLGFGKVSTYNTYSRFIVADKNNVDRLIYLFNGNLILEKTNSRFLSWLYARNAYSTDKIQHVMRGKQSTDFQDNAWLSGFIDGEGWFNVVRTLDPRYTLGYRIRLRFILDQKNEPCILKHIQGFLGSGVISQRQSVDGMLRFTSTSISSHEKLIQYLTRHPLRTFKKVPFLRFTSLLRYIKNRPNLPWQGKVLKRVENLIKNIEQIDPYP